MLNSMNAILLSVVSLFVMSFMPNTINCDRHSFDKSVLGLGLLGLLNSGYHKGAQSQNIIPLPIPVPVPVAAGGGVPHHIPAHHYPHPPPPQPIIIPIPSQPRIITVPQPIPVQMPTPSHYSLSSDPYGYGLEYGKK